MGMLTPQQAVAMVENLSELFAVSPPGVALNCEEVFQNSKVLAAYDLDEHMICLRDNLVHERLIAHEFGHYVYHIYNGRSACGDKLCEAWAHFFEVFWQATGFEFRCEVCGSRKPVKMLSTGEVQCLKCSSVYALSFY